MIFFELTNAGQVILVQVCRLYNTSHISYLRSTETQQCVGSCDFAPKELQAQSESEANPEANSDGTAAYVLFPLRKNEYGSTQSKVNERIGDTLQML